MVGRQDCTDIISSLPAFETNEHDFFTYQEIEDRR
jgi:hypothetical protein